MPVSSAQPPHMMLMPMHSSTNASSRVLTRVPVLGVGTTSVTSRTTESEDGATTEEVARTILTIAVTQEEAERLIQADRVTELNFALLTDDSKVENGPGANLGTIFPELPLRRQP